MDPNEPRYRTDALRVAVPGACLLLGLAVVLSSAAGWILVIGSRIVSPWLAAAALLLAALAIRWLGSRNGAGDRKNPRLHSPALALLAAAVVGAGIAAGSLLEAGTESFILDPQGPEGCRAAVRESAFLMSGSGTVYAVGAHGIGRHAGDWNTDDGYRPIAAGNYTLEWNATGGQLTVDGASTPNGYRLVEASEYTVQLDADGNELSGYVPVGPTEFEQQPVACR
ncbi:hypothetical protein [Arthrobacter sp. zg-Y179]|uniref:hypothetical protein n=1 Tax=Arthrobacter sp. zg-Y179 TaxID=2894188 RepID=UPI001E5562E8|nr:hypothetical protein [Arthrobacter sp. zg-Y179]MCC9174884.1 hypothetical protein [Arthrobacter sp. zg-Y179]